MTTKKRVGPITSEMLPIPEYKHKTAEYFERYEMGEGGGWTKDPIDEENFINEFYDLLDRYGGIDCDGDSRLRAVLYDRTVEDCPFMAIPRTKPDSTKKEFIRALRMAKGNLEIATSMINRIMVDWEYKIKDEK